MASVQHVNLFLDVLLIIVQLQTPHVPNVPLITPYQPEDALESRVPQLNGYPELRAMHALLSQVAPHVQVLRRVQRALALGVNSLEAGVRSGDLCVILTLR